MRETAAPHHPAQLPPGPHILLLIPPPTLDIPSPPQGLLHFLCLEKFFSPGQLPHVLQGFKQCHLLSRPSPSYINRTPSPISQPSVFLHHHAVQLTLFFLLVCLPYWNISSTRVRILVRFLPCSICSIWSCG